MNASILVELEEHRKRLEYYFQLKAQQEAQELHGMALRAAISQASSRAKTSKKKPAAPAPDVNPSSDLDRWIEIYSDRVQRLEMQAVRHGLVTHVQLKAARELHVH